MHKLKLHILFLFLSFTAYCQENVVEAAIDSTRIKIGSQANLTLKATVDTDAKVVFPDLKNVGLLEVIDSYPVDTIEEDSRYLLVKKYGLTQFDSGHYSIPSLSIEIDGRNYTTQALKLEVNDVVVDTTKQKMYDIKPIASQSSGSNFWWYLLTILGLLLVGLLIWWDMKRRKARVTPEVQLSPIDKAIGGLKRLDYQYSGHINNIKDYYSELTTIMRLYFEETLDIPAMESTTSGLLQNIRTATSAKRIRVSEDIYLQIEKVLKNADMAKFALSHPPEQQIIDDRATTENIIKTIEAAIPEPTQEEIEQTEAYKLAQLRKKELKKRKLIIAVCSILVIGTLAFFGSMRLYGYLQENVIGYPTDELWEGEWVKSEYGNPAITINTPKVLVREDLSKFMPKEAWVNVQEAQMFIHGVPFGDLYIMASTMKFVPGAQADVKAAINTTLNMWEKQGAKNITVNTEVFISEEQAEGVRAFGTLSFPGTERLYYEILYFQQFQGLQQVLIMRKDQDEYAIKIAEKIKKSIQFKEVL